MNDETSSALPTDLFLSLTPHKVIEAVEASGVLCNRVCYALSSFENRVYEVECEDRSRIIAKFYRPGRWGRQQILEEHQFLADLEEAEVPVCATRPFPDGETVRQIDHIFYALFHRVGGRAPDEIDDAAAVRLGRLAARIHNAGAGRPAEHRLRLCGDTYVRQGLTWLAAARERGERGALLPERLSRRYLAAANALADIADERLRDVDTHRIHGDLHLGNLLLRDEIFFVLDFDDMLVGPAVQDLWLLLPGRDEATRRRRALFIDAYEELRQFDRASLRLIEPLRALRLVHYAIWLARRWHDPIFPRTFGYFGTEAYWAEQTKDLEDLLAFLRAESGEPAAAIAEPLPEEKYFWDMDA